jgi:hypothetical protein
MDRGRGKKKKRVSLPSLAVEIQKFGNSKKSEHVQKNI